MTCQMCFTGRHVRCTNKTGCGCNVCVGETGRVRRRTATVRPASRKSATAELRGASRHSTRSFGTDNRRSPDDLPEMVLELLQRIARDMGVAA